MMAKLAAAAAYLRDLAERVASTFVEAFAGILLAQWTGVLPADWRGWLTASALAAAVATLKGLAAKKVGDSKTPSLLPSLASRRVPSTGLTIDLPWSAGPGS